MSDNPLGSFKGKILVIDDTPDNLHLLSRILTRKGYQVQVFTGGQEALTSFQEHLPDLILLDICMPEMNGYEVCEKIKTDHRTRDIPVIFISALDEIGDKMKAFDAGGVDYVTKPFRAAEVLARVTIHLTLRRLQRQLQEQNALLKQEIRDRLAAEAALQAANQELQRLANLDGLTQVANRRCFDQRLEQEWNRLAREQLPLSLILCDIDYFKRYNDTYGHQLGDDCLRTVAATLSAAARRPADLVARYGGEEFAVILPNTPLAGAVQVAEEIRERVAKLLVPHEGSLVNAHVTLSLGVSEIVPCAEFSADDLVASADRALYQAKTEGRNRVATAAFATSSTG